MKIIQRKAIFYYTLGILTTSVISVFAAATILSKNISYSNPNTSATNVEDALNELYKNDGNCKINIGDTYYYGYSGTSQYFIAPCSGYYTFSAWGAQGGSYTYKGGNGAYVTGTVYVNKNTFIYVYVGGKGGENSTQTNIGGYNGGGYSGNNTDVYSAGGGGATDFRLKSGLWNDEEGLKSRILVAAGGSGTTTYLSVAGVAGGTIKGINGISNISPYNNYSTFPVTAGTQISGGMGNLNAIQGSFGMAIQSNTGGWAGGGGSGYYGGANGCGQTGASGSSYISGYQGCVAISSATSLTPRNDANGTQCTESSAASDITCSYHYSGYVFTNANMIAGNASMPTHDGTSTMTGNSGNGYARITYLGTTLN